MPKQMGKPKVITRCVANISAADNERIVEFSMPSKAGRDGLLGGLITFRRMPDDTLQVYLHRLDRGVNVVVSPERD